MSTTYVKITLEEAFVVNDKFMWNYEWKRYLKGSTEENGRQASFGSIAVLPRKIPIFLPRCKDYVKSGNRLIVPEGSIIEFRVRTTLKQNEMDILKNLERGMTEGFYRNGLGLFRYTIIKRKETLYPDDLNAMRLMDISELKELMEGRQSLFEIDGSEGARRELWLMGPEQILAITGKTDIPKGIQKILNLKA